MYTYIKRNIKGSYVELPNELTSDLYSNIGTTYSDYLAGMWVKLSDEQLQFKSEHSTASVEEVFKMALNVYTRTVADAIREKVSQLQSYNSNHVRDFTYEGNSVWLDDYSRTMKRVEAQNAEERGKATIELNSTVSVAPKAAISLLNLMADREVECKQYVDTTTATIQAMTESEIDTIDSLDVTTAYPAAKAVTATDVANAEKELEKTSTEKQISKLLTMSINTLQLDDSQALEVKLLYPEWSTFIGKSLSTGMRVLYNGHLYNVRQEVSTVLENQPPSIDTAALYEEINETNAGTIDDPIPYNNNMALEEGKYYIQNDVIYLCTRSTGQAVYNNLSDLVGIYVTIPEL